MAAEDYTPHTRGTLKLKGAHDAKITKKKKKKQSRQLSPSASSHANPTTANPANPNCPDDLNGSDGPASASPAPKMTSKEYRKRSLDEHDPPQEKHEEAEPERNSGGDEEEEPDASAGPAAGKTAAQLRHEERRRQRLSARLEREGLKTHKERVEELNRYLSNLSEHHDMPRIGPG